MDPVFKKLNLKNQALIHIVKAPDSFLSTLASLPDEIDQRLDFSTNEPAEFILVFCQTRQEVDHAAVEANKQLQGDGILWIAYPKGSSKKYTCDFNRDTGWALLGKLGFEPVRQVAIDEDWSALRFRRVQYIQKMTRGFAMTKEGKAKTHK